MRTYKTVSLILIIALIYSCSLDDNESLTQIISEKETTYNEGELVFKEEMISFFEGCFIDSVLLLTSIRNEYPITVVSLTDFSTIANVGDRGSGPEGVDNMIFSIKNIFDNGNPEFVDINRKKLINVGYNQENEKYVIKKRMMPDSIWPSINVNNISDTLFFANGVAPFNNGLYFKWNSLTSTKEWVPYYPEIKKKYSEDISHLYLNTIVSNQEKDIVISALRFFNRIVAYDFYGNIIKDIQVGEAAEPVIEDLETLRFSDNSEQFFTNIVASKKYIYCLWNRAKLNSLEEEQQEIENSKIFVFDWNLNHVSTIKTNQPLVSICIEPNDRYFLGFTFDEEEDTSIYKFNLN